jgi:hypothetical protein
MSEKQLVTAVLARFQAMPAVERKRKVREFASEDPLNKKFIRQHFPDLYREIFRPSPVRRVC